MSLRKLNDNRGVPQSNILGPILFSVMLSDVQAVDSGSSTLVKFADDLTLSVLERKFKTKLPKKCKTYSVGPRTTL